MTPKEKANELISKYNKVEFSAEINDSIEGEYIYDNLPIDSESIIECALITVNEIIEGNFGDGYDHQFWMCVKQELEHF